MFLSATLAVATLTAAPAAAPPKFEIKDGDRIVWIGDTLVEREQRYGYWEAALHMAFPDKQFTLRNLGWSGDTVFGDARAGFDNQAKGFERLVSLTLELKPTVIFVSYGANESFEGGVGLSDFDPRLKMLPEALRPGLSKFEQGLGRLLDALKPANARVVLFSPSPVFVLESPRDSYARTRNAILKEYSRKIGEIAKERGLLFADLNRVISSLFAFGMMDGLIPEDPARVAWLTENGVHLTRGGYKLTAIAFLTALGHDPERSLRGPFRPDYQSLLDAIVAKNQLFFHRWRPQNETYLFGFRKHEQGKNAREVAEFDPLVAKAEDEIEKLLKPE